MTSSPRARGASTGKGTAAFRAIESARGPHALISDPLAAVLAGQEGFRWARSLPPAQHALMLDLVAVRTRWIDDACATFAGTSTGNRPQFVFLGAGYDARAYRLPQLRASAVFEADYGPVLDAKTALLARTGRAPLCRQHGLARLDLNETALDSPLADAGFQASRRTLWILEGLTGYLPEHACQRLFSQMRSLSAPGSRALCTFVGATGRAYGAGAPVSHRHVFCTNDGDTLLGKCGWNAAQITIGDFAETFNRTEQLGSYDYWLAQAST